MKLRVSKEIHVRGKRKAREKKRNVVKFKFVKIKKKEK